MLSNRIGMAVLGVGCLAAAGVGGYLAARQNVVTPAQVAASTMSATPPAESVVADSQPVARQAESAAVDSLRNAPAGPKPAAVQAPPAKRSSAPAQAPARAVTSKPAGQAAGPLDARIMPQPLPDRAPTSLPSPGADIALSAPAPEPPVARQEEARPPEPSAPPAPPARTFEELVIASNSVVGLQMETATSSDRARVEDRVEARVVRDIRVAGQVAVVAGSRAIGSVMAVERGGKFKERARLGIRFHTLVLADGSQLPISTETIYRYGDAPGDRSAAKVGGGAVAGAILGAILGGSKGAAIGTAAGAGAGTAAVMAGEGSTATFQVGAEVTARFASPVAITIER